MQANYGIAVDGRDGLVVANRSGVFRTVDGGASWTNITPKTLLHLVDHIEGHRDRATCLDRDGGQ